MQLQLLPASLALIVLLSPLVAADVATITQTAVSTPTPTSTQYTSDSDFQSALLAAHNFFRDEHNATALTWNDTSASYAATYAKNCAFKHSGGPTGENLAAGYANASKAVDAWGDERTMYDFNNAGFKDATGHFTQLVWKATTTVGCGRVDCENKDDTPGWYIVCEYYPPGNVIGSFPENVQAQVKGKSTDTIESGVGGAGSLRIPWRESLAVLGGAIAVAVALW